MARGAKIRIVGEGILNRRLARMPAVVRTGSIAAVKAETEDTRDDARILAPFLTGELRESIGAESESQRPAGRVVATARHATFVENGTEDTPEQPFMFPASEITRQRFPRRVKAEVGARLTGLSNS